jgi:error-prone DNA polymerase
VTKNEGTATFSDLQQFASGLICLTGGDEGPLAAALAKGGESAAREVLEKLTYDFGQQNVYVELQRHGERQQESRNQAMLRMARSLKLQIVATNGVRYANSYDREILDIFTAIRHYTKLDRAG